jgi:hypothetical protein
MHTLHSLSFYYKILTIPRPQGYYIDSQVTARHLEAFFNKSPAALRSAGCLPGRWPLAAGCTAPAAGSS